MKNQIQKALDDYKTSAKLEKGKAKQGEEMDNQVIRAYHQGKADAYDLIVIRLTYISKEL